MIWEKLSHKNAIKIVGGSFLGIKIIGALFGAFCHKKGRFPNQPITNTDIWSAADAAADEYTHLPSVFTLLSSYLKNSRTNISFLIFLSYQWYINAVFDRYDKI